MENKKIVRYEELTIHFKRRVMLVYHADRDNSIKTINHEGKTTNALELWYDGADYIVLIDDRSIPLIEWDSFQESECDEEIDSLIRLGHPDEFPDNLDGIFYS